VKFCYLRKTNWNNNQLLAVVINNIQCVFFTDRQVACFGNPVRPSVWSCVSYSCIVCKRQNIWPVFYRLVVRCPHSRFSHQRQNDIYYWRLIRFCIRAFDWYRNQRPWVTLNGHYLLYFTIRCFGATKFTIRNIVVFNKWQYLGRIYDWDDVTIKHLTLKVI